MNQRIGNHEDVDQKFAGMKTLEMLIIYDHVIDMKTQGENESSDHWSSV